jgi:hypothetical protein
MSPRDTRMPVIEGSLPGPSRTITVEPVKVPRAPAVPLPAPPERVPERVPERPEPAPEREPVPA